MPGSARFPHHLCRGGDWGRRSDSLNGRIDGRPVGVGRHGGVDQVVADIAPGDFAYVETIVDESLTILEREMHGLGMQFRRW